MNTNYFLATAKLLEEIEKINDSQFDAVHNWLCDQEDDAELIASILKEGKSLTGAMEYCAKKAREEVAKKAKFAMVEDFMVFGWIREYYLSDVVDKPTLTEIVERTKKTSVNKGTTNNSTPVKKQPEEEQLQLDLFGGDF